MRNMKIIKDMARFVKAVLGNNDKQEFLRKSR